MIRKYPAVVLVVHAHGHNDGAEAIVEHLGQKYLLMLRDGRIRVGNPYFGVSDRIAYDQKERNAETIVLEAAFPTTAAKLCDLAHIPPQSVTHVLLLVDANTFDIDRHGARIGSIADENGATAIGLGNVWAYDPVSFQVDTWKHIGRRTAGLVEFVERYLRLPVPFVATGPYKVIDREAHPIHEMPDRTETVTLGDPVA